MPLVTLFITLRGALLRDITRVNGADVSVLTVGVLITTSTNGIEGRCVAADVGNTVVDITGIIIVTGRVISGFATIALGESFVGIGALFLVAITTFNRAELTVITLFFYSVTGV